MAQILIYYSRHCCGLLLFCLIAAAPVAAQYRVDHWTTDNGLPQNTVRSIVQTRDGYLWLTTFDGLVRFDGARFTVFNKSNTSGLNSNRFTSIYEDKDGTLWAGTEDGGLTAHRNGVFRTYTTADGLESNQVPAINFNGNGEIYLNVISNFVYWRGGRFVQAPAEYDRRVVKHYWGATGTLWKVAANGVMDP